MSMEMYPENGPLPPPPIETPGKHHVKEGELKGSRVVGTEKLLTRSFYVSWFLGFYGGQAGLAPSLWSQEAEKCFHCVYSV